MTTRRQVVVASAVAGVAAGLPFAAQAQSAPIRIGEINSYSTIPQFTLPYRMGWQLAVDETNAAGGLLGRRVEVISRDDAGKPEDATRLATELMTSENVALITGLFVERRPRGGGLRIKKSDCFRRGRTAERRSGLGERQSLHLPAAAEHLHAVCDAGRRSRQASGEALGDHCAETMNTASLRSPTSSNC